MTPTYCTRCDSEDCRCFTSAGIARTGGLPPEARPKLRAVDPVASPPKAAPLSPPEVNGAELLDDVADYVARYVAFPSQASRDAVALWAVHTHTIQAAESTPRLALLSPEKGSGKTRTLEVLDLIVPGPMHAANLSAAALFRQIAAKPVVSLLMDECDTYLGPRVAEKHEELRALVNAGHRRGAVAYRCVGEPSKMQVVEFPAFAAVALAGIGDLPDTIIDRSIVIRMKRRAPDERIEQFRRRQVAPKGEALRKRLAVWAEANLSRLSDARPSLPTGIVDRAADVWEPLIALGDAAGGDWPGRARKAAVDLQGARMASDPSLGVQLLADVRDIFTHTSEDRLSSHELVDRLCALEEAPWGDLRGKPIDARGVARRLRPFDVRPHSIRRGDQVSKGYEQADFHDAWMRYLPALHPSQSVTTVTPLQPLVESSRAVTDQKGVTDANVTGESTATENRPSTREVTAVTVVTDPETRKARTEDDNGRAHDEAVDLLKVKLGAKVETTDRTGRPPANRTGGTSEKFSEVPKGATRDKVGVTTGEDDIAPLGSH